MSPVTRTLLTFFCIAFLVATLYSFLAGNILFGCIGIGGFLFAFITAVQLTPAAPKVCPKCGTKLQTDQHTLVEDK